MDIDIQNETDYDIYHITDGVFIMNEFEYIGKVLKDAGITYEQVMQLSMMMDEELANSLPEYLGLPDWIYKNLPRMVVSVKDEFVDLIGESNINWLTFANYDDGSVSGQVLLSPTAMAIIEKLVTNASMN